MKDALVPLEFSHLQCDYEEPACIIQSIHPTITAQMYYMRGNILAREFYTHIYFSYLMLHSHIANFICT